MSYPALPYDTRDGKNEISLPRKAVSDGETGEVDVQAGEDEIRRLNSQYGSIINRTISARSDGTNLDLEQGFSSDHKFALSQIDLEKAREEQRLVGHNNKRIPICFKDVSLLVSDKEKKGSLSSIRDLTDALTRFGKSLTQFCQTRPTRAERSEPSKRAILKNLSGLVLPGEMVVVLGRPGSGCTSFLKLISSQTEEFLKVKGDVLYGRMLADDFRKQFRKEAVYSCPEDVHYASLTVQQTLDFAVNAKAPESRLPGQSLIDYKTEVVSSLLKIFNLTHIQKTLVGNAQIRGISGGERKRLSIAEMMISGATISCWDNSTLGLDAASATDYVRSLRILTNVYKSTTFVSLYQASDVIFENFDKVLLLEDGHQVYFGPAASAKKYFQDLGFQPLQGQSIPDFLTSSIDQRQASMLESTVMSSEQLALKFRESTIYAEVENSIKNWLEGNSPSTLSIQSAPKNSLRKLIGWGKPPAYSSSLWHQVALTSRRHATLKIQDRFGLILQTITSITVALLCGSIYFQLPKTSQGVFTRGGVVFITLLYNAFTAFVELPTTLFGRPVLQKHKSFGFHRPSALYIGQIMFDIPMASAQILLFSIIVYFMAGLNLSIKSFLTFYLFLILIQASMTIFFRILGCISTTFDGAMKLACVFVILFVLTSGYLIPIQHMRPWVGWCYWVNPISYGFSAIMMNEFKDLVLRCTNGNLVPNGRLYSDISHQTCTLLGSISGTDLIDGPQYLKETFSYDVANLWRNCGILVVFIVGLFLINIFVGEKVMFTQANTSAKTYIKTGKSNNKFLGASTQRMQQQRKDQILPVTTKQRVVFTWESIDYSVPIGNGKHLQLLYDVSGHVTSGRLMALMGASGAGKSTLLDVLSLRKSIGTVSGTLMMSGEVIDENFTRGTGYCEQLDTHEPTQTVREALRFSAYLRQPSSISNDEKDIYVEEILDLLEMKEFADAVIGTPQQGLSVEERKRLTIGVELAAKPDLLLFLDEPTSGLDSQSAINIVRLLRKLADAGQAIICTIHQPNAATFNLFDDLLLLSGGRPIYHGPTKDLKSYFDLYGATCPPNINIAEHMLRVLQDNSGTGKVAKTWNRRWTGSNEFMRMKSKLQGSVSEISTTGPSSNSPENTKLSEGRYAESTFKASSHKPSQWNQLRLVTSRSYLSVWRTPGYSSTRIFNHVVVGLLTGLAYLNIGDSNSDLQYRVFVIFQITVLPSMILPQVEARYELARVIFQREKSSNMYSSFVFLTSIILSEIPQLLICSVLFFVCLYFPTGFSLLPSKAGYQFLIILLTELFSLFLGLAMGALTPSAYIASLFTPFLLVTFSLFCGVTVPPPNIPTFWRSWLYRLNPLTYLVGGMMETELSGLRVQCATNEFQYFTPPSNQTCQEYAGTFLETTTGYLQNPLSETSCAYCPFRSGDDFISQFGLSEGHRWRDLGILAVYVVSTMTIFYIAGSRIQWARR